MNQSIHQDTPENQACILCGAVDGFVTKPKPPHVGLYCRACNGWQRWLPKRELKLLVEPALPETIGHIWEPAPAVEQPPKYSPRQLAHPQNVDERLASLEHNVGIIAQLLMGARRVA